MSSRGLKVGETVYVREKGRAGIPDRVYKVEVIENAGRGILVEISGGRRWVLWSDVGLSSSGPFGRRAVDEALEARAAKPKAPPSPVVEMRPRPLAVEPPTVSVVPVAPMPLAATADVDGQIEAWASMGAELASVLVARVAAIDRDVEAIGRQLDDLELRHTNLSATRRELLGKLDQINTLRAAVEMPRRVGA